MSKKQLVIQHDLSKLDAPTLAQYLRDVSEFIGLDPDLNALDTIWMQNENGPGQSLVVYARRGTAEILRNKLNIVVESLTQVTVGGSIIFTATGSDGNRKEIAVGSKYITGLTGKALDDAIMTASTRALRRLTMQFTTLGLLDESEVKATVGDATNPATGAKLEGGPIAAVFLVPTGPANNAPGRDVTLPTPDQAEFVSPIGRKKGFTPVETTNVPALPAEPVVITGVIAVGGGSTEADLGKPTMQEMRDEATAFLAGKAAAKPVCVLSNGLDKVDKPKRARKPRNSVSLETGPEAEVYSPGAITAVVQAIMTADAAPAPEFPTGFPIHEVKATAFVAALVPIVSTPDPLAVLATQAANCEIPAPVAPLAQVIADAFVGKPSVEQMADYRKKVSVFTSQLPSSENLGSVQKMRAFITRMSGTAPQFMTVDQWEETLAWFESFVGRNQIKGLVTYINDALGVK